MQFLSFPIYLMVLLGSRNILAQDTATIVAFHEDNVCEDVPSASGNDLDPNVCCELGSFGGSFMEFTLINGDLSGAAGGTWGELGGNHCGDQ